MNELAKILGQLIIIITIGYFIIAFVSVMFDKSIGMDNF
jgi:hypothetical protein